MPELIRPSTVLPALRTPIAIKTSDGLNLVGEVATPEGEITGSLLMLHPNPSRGGMMDSHIYKKAANRLPAMAGIQIIRLTPVAQQVRQEKVRVNMPMEKVKSKMFWPLLIPALSN